MNSGDVRCDREGLRVWSASQFSHGQNPAKAGERRFADCKETHQQEDVLGLDLRDYTSCNQ